MKHIIGKCAFLLSLVTFDASATVVTHITASGYDEKNGHLPQNAIDGSVKTRWAVNGDGWLQLALAPGAEINNVVIVPFKAAERRLRFSLYWSADGQRWQPLAQQQVTASDAPLGQKWVFSPVAASFLKIETFGTDVNKWSAINEVRINDDAPLPAVNVSG